MSTGKPGVRALAAGAGLAVLALCAVPSAEAQWFPPLGAASPSEILTRLRAQGYAPMGPLVRRDTIYLADVKGPAGRGRLVIDAWSGAVLQSFVWRERNWRPGAPAGYVARGGEFDSPPPLAPPTRGDFLDPNNGFAYGAPGEAYPVIVGPDGAHEAKPKPKHKPPEPKSAALPSEPMDPAPAVGASPSPAPAPVATAPAAPPPAASQPQAAPKPAATVAETPPQKPAAPAAPASPSSTAKSKVNDVPVNPLE